MGSIRLSVCREWYNTAINLGGKTMDIDINKAKDIAQDALEKVTKDATAKKTADDAINAVEKKVGIDLPDVDTISKALGNK